MADSAVAEEIRKRKQQEAEDSLTADDEEGIYGDTSGDEQQAESDATDASSADNEPISIGKKGAYQYELVPLEEDKKKKEEQPPAPQADLTVPTPTPESPSAPADIQTDPETGTRYVEDQGIKIPHAELATPAEREAFKPSDVVLPKITTEGVAPAPRVERGERVLETPTPTPESDAQIQPGTPPQVQPAQPVQLPNAPIEQQPPTALPNAPVDQTKPTPLPNAQVQQPSQPEPEQPTTFAGMPIRGATASTANKTSTIPSQPAPSAQELNIDTDYNALPGSFHAGRPGDGKVHGIVLHSSDGREGGDVNTLTGHDPDHRVSSHYYVTRDGRIYQFVNDSDTAYHAGATSGPRAQYNNGSTIGIEQEHIDGKDQWDPRQVAATAKLVAMLKNKYGLSDAAVMGHSDVAPDRKQDPYNFPWEHFHQMVDASGGAVTASDKSAGGASSGFVSGKATGFGFGHFDPKHPDLLTLDPDDNGVGAPRLGTINTNDPKIIGLAIPEEALRRRYGNNTAAWRRARVEVVTEDGRHYLMPIVDLGPKDTSKDRGVAADMTYGASVLTGQDKNNEQNFQFRIVDNAGPDVNKDPGAFIQEQKSLQAGTTYQPKAARKGSHQYELVPLDQSGNAAPADKPQVSSDQIKSLVDKYKDTPNLGAVYKDIDNNTNISPEGRAAFKSQIQKQMTDQMMEYDPTLTRDQAWAKWHNSKGEIVSTNSLSLNPNASDGINADSIKDTFSKIVGAHIAFTNTLQNPIDTERNVLDRFFKYSGANTKEKQDKIMTDLHGMSPNDQFNYLQKIIPQDTGVQNVPYSTEVIQAMNHLADHNWVQQNAARRTKDIHDAAVKMAGDPRMRATFGGSVGDTVSAFTSMAEAGMVPGDFGFVMQAADQEHGKLKTEHPDWTEDQINRAAITGSLVNSLGQIAGMHVFSTVFEPIMKNIGNPVLRRITNAVASAFGTGTTAAAGSLITSPGDLGEAGKQFKQGAAMGLIGAAGHTPEGRARVEEPPLAEHGPPVPPDLQPKEEPPLGEHGPPAPEEPQQQQQAPPQPPPPKEEPKEEPNPEVNEEDLNKQNDELDKKIGGSPEPPEPKDAPDIPDHVPVPEPPPEPPLGEHGPPAPPEPQRQPDLDVRPRGDPDLDVGPHGPPAPPEPPKRTAGTPSINDIKVTPEERAALAPEMKAVKDAYDEHSKNPTVKTATTFSQAFKAFTDKAMAKWRPIMDANGIGLKKNDPKGIDPVHGEAHLAAEMDNEGKLWLHNNNDILTGWGKAVLNSGGDLPQAFHQAMREELIHFGHHIEIRDLYDKTQQGKTGRRWLNEFTLRHPVKVVDDALRNMHQARARGDAARNAGDEATAVKEHATANTIRDSLINSRMLYGEKRAGRTDKEIAADWRDHLTLAKQGEWGSMNKLHGYVAELVRQLVQAKGHGQGKTTEGDAPLDPRSKSVVEWYKTALAGLKTMYKALKSGNALSKTELGKLIRGVERQIKRMEENVTVKNPITPADINHAIKMAKAGESMRGSTPLAAAKTGKHWWESKEEKPWEIRKTFKQMFAGGESAMLDHEETRTLAKAIKRFPSAMQEIAARTGVHKYVEAWKEVGAKGRANKNRVTKEFHDWIKAEQTGAPKPTIGADTANLIKISKDVKEQIGKEMARMNTHVIDSKGVIRKAKIIGRDYWQRTHSEEFKDMIERRDGARASDFNSFVAREIGRGNAKTRDEVVDRYAHTDPHDTHSNEPFSNMEKARENFTPHEGVDYHPSSDFKYMQHAVRRLAQVDSFGQKLSNKGRDLFDIAANKVEASGNLSRRAKDVIINRIRDEQRHQYGNTRTDPIGGISSRLRALASGTFLGNPISSFYNALSGGAHNLAYGGGRSFAKTAAHLADPANMRSALADAKDRNILRDNMHEMIGDLDLAHDQGWMTKGIRGYNSFMMKWGGQNATEALNRVFAMQQGKFWLREFTSGYGDNTAKQRHLEGQLERLGFNKSEVQDLYNEQTKGGGGPKSDEFLRQWVMQTHGSYDASQTSARIFDHPVGKVLMQFQKWAANAGRVYIREFGAPLARGISDFKKNPHSEQAQRDLLYHLGRNLAYLGVGYGAGSLAIFGRQLMTGAPPADATSQDILKLIQQGNNGAALQEALGKAWHAMVMSGFMGTAGNYADLIQSFATGKGGLRVKDPRSFAISGIVQPLIDWAQGAMQEQALGPAAPSQNLTHKLFDTFSAGRTLLPMGLNLLNHVGIHTPWGDEMKGKNDYMALKMHLAQYEHQNPGIVEANALKGSKDIQAVGRSVKDPVSEDLQRNLVSGNVAGAKKALNDYLSRFPVPQRAGIFKAFQQSIRMKNPVNPGGSNKLDSAVGFLSWAKQTLPEDEARQLFSAAQTYASTAMRMGIFNATPGTAMPFLAHVDYDKFQPHGVAQKKADIASVKAAAAFMAREKAAQQLQHR